MHILPALLLLPAAGSVAQEHTADPTIERAALERHVAALTAPEIGTRQVGSPGADRVAGYLADALAELGLQPGGDDGRFLQAIPSVFVSHASPPRLIVTEKSGNQIEGTYGVDFKVFTRGEPRSTSALRVLRIGEVDDMPLEVDPETALFFRLGGGVRERLLAGAGLENGVGFALELEASGAAQTGKPLPAPASSLHLATEAQGCERVVVRGPLRDKFIWMGVKTVQLLYDLQREERAEYNVIGILPGSDPDLADEGVLLTSPYDYLGPRADGSIPRGDNDLTGCAALLEIARTLAQGAPPRRTVVFLFVTGSRQGRFGLNHYLEHPAFPLEQTVAGLVLKRLGLPGGMGGPWFAGEDRTNLVAAFTEQGSVLVKEPKSRGNLFQRMDGGAFARRGIVSHTVACGGGSNKDGSDSTSAVDYDHLAACVEALRRGVFGLADGTIQPAWGPQGPPRVH